MNKLLVTSNKSESNSLGLDSDSQSSEFYKRGFATVRRNQYKIDRKFWEEIGKLNSNLNNFESKEKNAGSLTLYNEIYNQNHELFVNYLFDTGLLGELFQIVGMPLYLTNYVHLLTLQSCPELSWHRDTHLYTGSVVGNIPPVIKLIIYGSEVKSGNSGEFEILTRTNRFDLHSQWFDNLLSLSRFRKYSFLGNIGDCLVFDSSAIHRRCRTHYRASRSATIYGFVTAKWQQKAYFNNHMPIIDFYKKKLESLFQDSL